MSLSKNKLKYIQSLKDKKGRKVEKVFVAEGDKMVSELLSSIKCRLLIATSEFLDSISQPNSVEEIVEVKNDELNRISFVKNPQNALGVFYQPEYDIESIDLGKNLSLALDEIQDPGNLGTIVRLADWYGIENIFCSQNTADIYNPKVVQATMGAIARVKVHYLDLETFLKEQKNIPIYGTFLDGEDMYGQELSSNGIIVMGNEGNGISKSIEECINKKLYIPSFPESRITSESLNVSVATAVICAEFRRRFR